MKTFVFWLNVHWSLFLRVQLTITHYLNQCWPSSLRHICGIRGRWVNWLIQLIPIKLIKFSRLISNTAVTYLLCVCDQFCLVAEHMCAYFGGCQQAGMQWTRYMAWIQMSWWFSKPGNVKWLITVWYKKVTSLLMHWRYPSFPKAHHDTICNFQPCGVINCCNFFMKSHWTFSLMSSGKYLMIRNQQ